MKPFECDICKNNIKIIDAVVRWHYEKNKKLVENLQIVHNKFPCNDKLKENYFNRELPLDYVYKNMPEFIFYISRFEINKKELKEFINRIEKDRSYIRRHNVNKKEVKKLIIRMDGVDI